jgi:uncharacterized protein
MKIMMFLLLCLLCLPVISSAEEPLEVTWEDLVPMAPRSAVILDKMGEEERGFVEWIIYLRQYLPAEIEPENEEFYKEMQEAMPKLLQKGIDVDAIIAERKVVNSSLNKDLDGKVIRLKGFMLPLDLSGKAVEDFLLVPFVGACIHTPPPPLNQIVYAKLAKPMDFRMEDLFLPATITGKLMAKNLSRELFLVDGSNDLDIGYTMMVTSINNTRPEKN